MTTRSPLYAGLVFGLGVAIFAQPSAQAQTMCTNAEDSEDRTNPLWSDCRRMDTYGEGRGYYANPNTFTAGPANDEAVVVYRAQPVAPATVRNQLLIFIHGGGARALGASQFLLRAAQAGYSVIGIDYHGFVNDVQTSPEDLCGNDSDCFGEWFERQWEGGIGPIIGPPPAFHIINLPWVPENSSLKKRLYTILRYYINEAKNDGTPGGNGWATWAQYLDGQGQIDWSKIVLVGHSQGTGLTTYLAKKKAVDKVILFSGLQWTITVPCPPEQDNCTGGIEVPPAWMLGDADWKTENKLFYAFVDTYDHNYEPEFVITLKSQHLALDTLHYPGNPNGFALYPGGAFNRCNAFLGYHVIEADNLCDGATPKDAHNGVLLNPHGPNPPCSGDDLVYRYHIWDHLLAAPGRSQLALAP